MILHLHDETIDWLLGLLRKQEDSGQAVNLIQIIEKTRAALVTITEPPPSGLVYEKRIKEAQKSLLGAGMFEKAQATLRGWFYARRKDAATRLLKRHFAAELIDRARDLDKDAVRELKFLAIEGHLRWEVIVPPWADPAITDGVQGEEYAILYRGSKEIDREVVV